MSGAKIPAPANSDEEPFEIGCELTVFQAAMIYAGRHPHPRFLKGASIDHHLEFMRAGIPQQPRSRLRARARRNWDIYCEIIRKIEGGEIWPIRRASDRRGRLDPVRTVIRTSDLEWLAAERGERPKYLGRPAVAKSKSEPRLRKALDLDIRDEIHGVYRTTQPPPNIKKLSKLVKSRLNQRGLDASENRIAEIGSDQQFKNLRRPPGKTLASERR